MDVLPIKSYAVVIAFTDSPLLEDEGYDDVKIREVDVVAFDGKDTCTVLWGGKPFTLPLERVYEEPGRMGEVKALTVERLQQLPTEYS